MTLQVVHKNPWFEVIRKDGYYYVNEPESSNGAVVLLKSKRGFVFVEVFRAPHGGFLLEVPRGYGLPGETSEECARREAFEETGYVIDNLQPLGFVRPNSSILSSKIRVFLARAREERDVHHKDTKEVRKVVHVSEAGIAGMIQDGRITDGLSLSALALYWAMKNDV